MDMSEMARSLADACIRARARIAEHEQTVEKQVNDLARILGTLSAEDLDADQRKLQSQMEGADRQRQALREELESLETQERDLEAQAGHAADALDRACRALAERLPTEDDAGAADWARWVAVWHRDNQLSHEHSLEALARLLARGVGQAALSPLDALAIAMLDIELSEQRQADDLAELERMRSTIEHLEAHTRIVRGRLLGFAGSEPELRIVADLPEVEPDLTHAQLAQVQAVLRSFEAQLAMYAASADLEKQMLDRLT